MKAITYAGLILALTVAGITPTCHAQTNSWTNSASSVWYDAGSWSLGITPTNIQSVYISNDVSKTVTIDAATSSSHPDTMTVSNLFLSAPAGLTNTLNLSSSGTNSPLRILDTFSISGGGLLSLSNATLSTTTITNSLTNGFLTVDGSAVVNTSSFLVADSGMYVGVETDATGLVLLKGGQLFLTNTAASAVGVNGIGQMIVSNGQVQTSFNFFFVGSGKDSQGALTVAGGKFVASPYARLVVGMETGAVGAVSVSSGSLIMTNSFITLIGGDGLGQLNLWGGTNILGTVEVGGDPGSQGTMTVTGGATTVQGPLQLGSSFNATGAIWMTGGQLTQTNVYLPSASPTKTNYFPTCLGSYGAASITVSNGNWSGGTMVLGVYSNSLGTVDVDGGKMTLLSMLVLGNCPTGGVGVVNVAGGSLYVTNAAHNAFIDVRDGQLNLNGGTLQTDILVMTNACGVFAKGGGTLVVGSLVLDPKLSALGDGIPNGWKQQYGFNPLDPSVANADPDGDGMSNLQEFLAGTDPTNSASRFRITSIVTSGSDIAISWSAVTGKTYTVRLATNTFDGSFTGVFTDLVTVAVPTSPAITETNYLDLGAVTNATTRFYQIRLVTP